MRKCSSVMMLLVFCLTGCNSSSTSTPPGAGGGPASGGPPGMTSQASVPPGGIQAGRLVAMPPESWGEPNSLGGNKNWNIETDSGKVFVTAFNPSVSADEQVARFQKMIKPSTAVKTDKLDVSGTSVSWVSGDGTRMTFNDDDMTDVARELPGESVIGIVFGSGKTELAIMVDGKTEAVKAFSTELESWVKSFK